MEDMAKEIEVTITLVIFAFISSPHFDGLTSKESSLNSKASEREPFPPALSSAVSAAVAAARKRERTAQARIKERGAFITFESERVAEQG